MTKQSKLTALTAQLFYRMATVLSLSGASLLFVSVMAFNSISSARTLDKTYVSNDEISWGTHAFANLDFAEFGGSHGQVKEVRGSWCCNSDLVEYQVRESNYLVSQWQKMPVTYVLIHGLYGGASQWDQFITNIRQITAANFIELTLPGHYRDSNYEKPIKMATRSDWEQATEETLLLAHHLSEKVVLVGQSTGGLLAVDFAVRHPEWVSGVVLLEPALQVRAGVTAAACISKMFVKDAGSVSKLSTALGFGSSKGISPALGCEVVKLSEELFYKRTQPVYDSPRNEGEWDFSEAASKLTMPVLLINNRHDAIVSYDVNRRFAAMNPKINYAELNIPKIGHGDQSTADSDIWKPMLLRKFCDFMITTAQDHGCFNLIYHHLVFPENRSTSTFDQGGLEQQLVLFTEAKSTDYKNLFSTMKISATDVASLSQAQSRYISDFNFLANAYKPVSTKMTLAQFKYIPNQEIAKTLDDIKIQQDKIDTTLQPFETRSEVNPENLIDQLDQMADFVTQNQETSPKLSMLIKTCNSLKLSDSLRDHFNEIRLNYIEQMGKEQANQITQVLFFLTDCSKIKSADNAQLMLIKIQDAKMEIQQFISRHDGDHNEFRALMRFVPWVNTLHDGGLYMYVNLNEIDNLLLVLDYIQAHPWLEN